MGTDNPFVVVDGFWPDPDVGPWYVRLYFGEVEGRAQCVGLELRSFRWSSHRSDTTEGEVSGSLLALPRQMQTTPLTTSVLRRFKVAEVVAETKQSQAAFREWWAEREPARAAEIREAAQWWGEEPKGKGGRPSYGPDFYRKVAEVYAEAWRGGDNPTKAVAQDPRLEHTPVSKSTAANWVSKARQMGFLGKTTRGKGGGVTPQRRRRKQ